MMKSLTMALSAVALLAVAACTSNPNRPTDTGNMAYPSPQRPGNIGGASTVGVTPTPDTGNMALPPRAQGNSTPGVTRP